MTDRFLGFTPGQWRTVRNWHRDLPARVQVLYQVSEPTVSAPHLPEAELRYAWYSLHRFDPPVTTTRYRPRKRCCCKEHT